MVMYRKYFKKDIDVVIFFAENVAFSNHASYEQLSKPIP
jgi:hypothetical protein